jgi:hypothetical protein
MKFQVEICRIGYSVRTIDVEAANAEEAENIALDTAGNYEFSEHHADYECNSVSPTSSNS